jgi:hypothetical protein
MKRLAVCLVAAFVSPPAFAGEPDLTSPAVAVRSYLLATKANDVESAKKCWTVDDGNASGTLDVVVGMWIETRKLVATTDARFGAEGLKLLGRWNRPSCTDRAIDRTLERVAGATLREGETAARLVVPWAPEDQKADPAFLCEAPFRLRRAGDQWKLDANVFTGVEKASDLFETGKLWAVWRDEMVIMKDLTAGLEKGQFKDLTEFERELKGRVDGLKAKYERKD